MLLGRKASSFLLVDIVRMINCLGLSVGWKELKQLEDLPRSARTTVFLAHGVLVYGLPENLQAKSLQEFKSPSLIVDAC